MSVIIIGITKLLLQGCRRHRACHFHELQEAILHLLTDREAPERLRIFLYSREEQANSFLIKHRECLTPFFHQFHIMHKSHQILINQKISHPIFESRTVIGMIIDQESQSIRKDQGQVQRIIGNRKHRPFCRYPIFRRTSHGVQ